MSRLLLFNPENDVRLGETPGKTPRKLTSNVVALGRDGGLLPMWWADDGDYILVREQRNAQTEQRADELREKFGLKGTLLFLNEHVADGTMGQPWGWSYDSAAIMSSAGAKCPDSMQTEQIRQLSHRRTGAEIARRLRQLLPFDIPEPATECTTIDHVREFLSEHNVAYVKAPWSCSGRGVWKLPAEIDARTENILSATLRRQGCLMCERALDGVQDFAMLFYADSGRADYRGLSVFNTSGDAYSGNIIAGEEELLLKLVGAGADRAELAAIREVLQTVLSQTIAPRYSGWMGVDMLLQKNGRIAPCIELNLRMTMGVVAIYLARRLADSGNLYHYTVGPVSSSPGRISITGTDRNATFGFYLNKLQ